MYSKDYAHQNKYRSFKTTLFLITKNWKQMPNNFRIDKNCDIFICGVVCGNKNEQTLYTMMNLTDVMVSLRNDTKKGQNHKQAKPSYNITSLDIAYPQGER